MIDNLLSAGVPAHKLAIGVAFYGPGWSNSDWQGEGFGTKAQAAYLVNDETNGFISFDNERSILAKAKWAKRKGADTRLAKM